jgi:hypothetical protein
MATTNFTRLFSYSGLHFATMKVKALALAVLLAGLIGCGGSIAPALISTASPTPAPAANVYFNSSMIGQTWTFVNGYGDHTFIDVQAAPAGSQAQVVWHYKKENCRAYWNPGDCTAELWFGISENPDGSWSATQFLLTCNGCVGKSTQASATIKPTDSGGYLVIPPQKNTFTTGNSAYVPCWQLDSLSWVPNNCNTTGATSIPWVTNAYMDNISTPAYSGPVLVSEQFENCPDVACVHEKWYFAPKLGLVKVEQIQSIIIDDPQLAMVRMNTDTITAAQVFSNKAETWEFKNGYGDLTWIDVAPQADGSTIWHYTKNAARAYWMEGGKDAEIYFSLAQDSTGAWYSTGGHIIAPFGFPWDATHTPQDFTYTADSIPGHPRPYLILADSGTTDDTVFPGDGVADNRWKTSMYIENGLLVSEQWEGPCIHEKWYFAIGRGLVKVIPYDNGSCTGLDPLLTMEKVN